MNEVLDLAHLPNAWSADRRAIDRFLDKIEVDERGCWIWTAARNGGPEGGYASFSFPGVTKSRMVLGHRFSYALFVGPIPEDKQLDHLCRVRYCVNPAHLEVVTGQENLIRGKTIAARYAERTHCQNGHEFTEENTRFGRRTPGSRECRACTRERVARRRSMVVDG